MGPNGQEVERVDLDRRRFELASQWPHVLARARRFTLTMHKAIWAIIAHSYATRKRSPTDPKRDWAGQAAAALSRAAIARATGLDQSGVAASIREMLGRNILTQTPAGELGINPVYPAWEGSWDPGDLAELAELFAPWVGQASRTGVLPRTGVQDAAPGQASYPRTGVLPPLDGRPGGLDGRPGGLDGRPTPIERARVSMSVMGWEETVPAAPAPTDHDLTKPDNKWFLSEDVSEPEPPAPAPTPAARPEPTPLPGPQLPACATNLADISWTFKWRPVKDSDVIPPEAWLPPTGPHRPDPQGRAHWGGVAATDPIPDTPYRWGSPQAGDWWVQPWVPLPHWPDVYALGIRALCDPTPRGDDQDRRKPARWHFMIKALHGCARDFWEARGQEPEVYRQHEKLRAFWELLPQVRLDACTRPAGKRAAKAERPYELSRALARLWTVCAMTRPDSAGDEFWARKIKTPGDLARHLTSLLKQVKEGEWPEREEQRYGQLGGA